MVPGAPTQGGVERQRGLAVDEVDRTSDTGWARATLMTLLDTRYARRGSLATLIATNQNPDRLPAELGYLASRMRDGERVLVGEEDVRGRPTPPTPLPQAGEGS